MAEDSVLTQLTEFDSMWADSGEEQTNNSILNNLLGKGSENDSSKKKVKREKQKNKVKSSVLPSSKLEKKKRDDERRRQSLIEKAKLKNQQQLLIKSALSAKDATRPKKIIFDSEDLDDDVNTVAEVEENLDEIKKSALFSDEEDEGGSSISFEKSFDDKKGAQILKLQSRFNYDDRFRVDERFLDDDDNDTESPETNKNKRPLEMVRFDPSEQTISHEKSKKSNKKQQPTESAPAISKEKYFEVSDSIKDVLKEGSKGFSLLAAYGGNTGERSSKQEDDYDAPKIITKRNPLIDLSSDDESEPEEIAMDPSEAPWRPAINFPLSDSRDRFFFQENDPLLTEALEFINKKNSDEAKLAASHFNQTRRVLKKVFKDQFAKRTKMFKKKIGGMKKVIPQKKLMIKKRNKSNRR